MAGVCKIAIAPIEHGHLRRDRRDRTGVVDDVVGARQPRLPIELRCHDRAYFRLGQAAALAARGAPAPLRGSRRRARGRSWAAGPRARTAAAPNDAVAPRHAAMRRFASALIKRMQHGFEPGARSRIGEHVAPQSPRDRAHRKAAALPGPNSAQIALKPAAPGADSSCASASASTISTPRSAKAVGHLRLAAADTAGKADDQRHFQPGR